MLNNKDRKGLLNKNSLEIATEIIKNSKNAIATYDLLHKVCLKCNISSDDHECIIQIYLDINSSAKFIFCDDGWLLKENNIHNQD